MEETTSVAARFCLGRRESCYSSKVRPSVFQQSRRDVLLAASVGNFGWQFSSFYPPPSFLLFSLANESSFIPVLWLWTSGSLCCSVSAEILQIHEMESSFRKELQSDWSTTPIQATPLTRVWVELLKQIVGESRGTELHSLLLPEERFLQAPKRILLLFFFFLTLSVLVFSFLFAVHHRPQLEF